MTYATTALNTAASDETAHYAYISLHTADPGTTGASEATGGSPAYARQSAGWGSPVAGVATSSQVTFNVPAGSYTHFGLWSAATGGTFYAGHALSATQSPTGQGTVQLTATLTVSGS